MKRFALAFGIAALAACHASASADHDAAAEAPCTKLGAPCTFAPGKLGSCVEVEHPSGPSTFVCQSQH